MTDDTGQTVYVLMASKGEYSDRIEWVCGVYTDPDSAKQIAEQKSAEAREAERRQEDYVQRRDIFCGIATGDSYGSPAYIEREAKWQEFRRINGDMPSPEADRYWVVSASLNEFGKWDTWFDVKSDG